MNKPFDCCPIIVIDVFWLWRSLLSVSKWLVDLKSTSGREWQGKPNEHMSANGKPRKPTHFPKNRRWWTVAQSGSKTKMCVTQCIFSYQAFVLTQYGFRLVGGFLTTPTIFAPNLLVRRRSLNSENVCFYFIFHLHWRTLFVRHIGIQFISVPLSSCCIYNRVLSLPFIFF